MTKVNTCDKQVHTFFFPIFFVFAFIRAVVENCLALSIHCHNKLLTYELVIKQIDRGRTSTVKTEITKKLTSRALALRQRNLNSNICECFQCQLHPA